MTSELLTIETSVERLVRPVLVQTTWRQFLGPRGILLWLLRAGRQRRAWCRSTRVANRQRFLNRFTWRKRSSFVEVQRIDTWQLLLAH